MPFACCSFYGWILVPFVVRLRADGCHPLASGCNLLACGYHSLVNFVYMYIANFYFGWVHVQQLTPMNRRGSGCQARQILIRDWRRSNEHHALIAEAERLHANAMLLGTADNPSLSSLLGASVASPYLRFRTFLALFVA